MADLHQALRTEITDKKSADGVEFVLVRLQDSKDDIRYSLHARPNSYSTAGAQTTDLLALLGFRRSNCAFFGGTQCYVRSVDASFDLPGFTSVFQPGYQSLRTAESHLQKCGLFLPLTEGWGYYSGRPSKAPAHPTTSAMGDGHTGHASKRMKESEDDRFFFVLSWLESDREKGWTTHYRAKQQSVSAELQSVFGVLGLATFPTCPEFDFEPCFWRFTPFQPRGAFEGNADTAHSWFDAHVDHFPPGIEQLTKLRETFIPFGPVVFPYSSTSRW